MYFSPKNGYFSEFLRDFYQAYPKINLYCIFIKTIPKNAQEFFQRFRRRKTPLFPNFVPPPHERKSGMARYGGAILVLAQVWRNCYFLELRHTRVFRKNVENSKIFQIRLPHIWMPKILRRLRHRKIIETSFLLSKWTIFQSFWYFLRLNT